ncbi:MAG: DUF4270 family protein [Pedobacter sp.]|uniref:DUF4270 family protein n=1 Tax=Pedobacter sp. TaxID=1411316 RepID=UPI00339517DA
MKFSKLDLLTLLISLFLFSSCKDSSSIGLDVDSSTAVSGTLLDTVTVTSRTVRDEATQTFYGAGSTSNPTRYPLGMMVDPIFGSTTASLAMSVNLPSSTATSFSTTPVTIDSAVLTLAYTYATDSLLRRAREFYGDSTANYNITVSQLAENLSTQGSWLSTKNYASGDVLGTYTGPVKPYTKVKVTTIVTGGADTSITKKPHLRIKLSADLIKSKIAALDSLSLTTDAKFNAAFRGLKVTATTTGTGGMMFLDFTTGLSNLEIYYKQQNATTTTQIDTIYKAFPISSATNPVAATVTHNYTNTPVATQINTPGDYQVTYLQAMNGIRNKISFPYLKNLTTTLGSKIVINKAELVIDSSNPADSIPFKIPPRLAMYRLDIAGQRQNVADANVYDATTNSTGDTRPYVSGVKFDGFYRFIKSGYLQNSYSFNITNYVQDLVDGKTVDYGTFIAPIATEVTAITYLNTAGQLTTSGNTAPVLAAYAYPTQTSAGRVVIGSFNNTNGKKIRLNIYYVKTSTK